MNRRDLYCEALGLPPYPDPMADIRAWSQRMMAERGAVPSLPWMTELERRYFEQIKLVPDDRA